MPIDMRARALCEMTPLNLVQNRDHSCAECVAVAKVASDIFNHQFITERAHHWPVALMLCSCTCNSFGPAVRLHVTSSRIVFHVSTDALLIKSFVAAFELIISGGCAVHE